MRKTLSWAAALLLILLLLWQWPRLAPAFGGSVRAAADLLAQTGHWGPPLVIALQVIQAVVSPLPSWPVTVAAGALYGPWLGTLYVLVGGTLGAAINFALARHYGRPLVVRVIGQKWVDRAGKLNLVHLLVLSLFGRLIPVASFDAVAYVAGISQVGVLPFLGVAVAGQAPAFFAYAYFGSDLAQAKEVGLVSTLLLMLFLLLILGGHRLWRRLSDS